ncbi:MAG TPA: pentapeptide repeat-containing protein [Geobacteraceae bacterium]|nr:pentapeptide repeat-containing protein [Geobacteraceae bacterium]
MRLFIFCLVAAALIPAMAPAASSQAPTASPQAPAASSQAPATNVKEEINAALGLPAKPSANNCGCPEPPKKPAVDKSTKKVVHRSRALDPKNRAGKNGEHEPLPGERLTMSQVMKLLKTTRNFSGKNLSGLKLTGLDLSKCNFKGADLSGAELKRANFMEANLETADLSGADMEMTDLRLTGMKGARLENARLDGSIWPDKRICAKNSIGLCRESAETSVSQ